MQISIRNRCKPFTHTPGVKVLLPGTNETHEIYPSGIEGFTVLLDLERGQIVVLGKKYKKVIGSSKKVDLERLSFGVHKKQEWEGVYKRCSVEEFLPLWYQLAQWYEPTGVLPKNSLLEACFKDTEPLQHLFKSGFSNLLYPHATDPYRYGFDLPPLGDGQDPMLLLSEGRTLIRSLFFKKEGSALHFLPRVPKGIHCGRFLNIQEEGMRVDFEWTKHLPRRLILKLAEEKTITLHFPEIREYRVKNVNQRHLNGSTVTFPPGRHLIDQFKK